MRYTICAPHTVPPKIIFHQKEHEQIFYKNAKPSTPAAAMYGTTISMPANPVAALMCSIGAVTVALGSKPLLAPVPNAVVVPLILYEGIKTADAADAVEEAEIVATLDSDEEVHEDEVERIAVTVCSTRYTVRVVVYVVCAMVVPPSTV